MAIAVDGSSGVDLARVGLALGLDPASVRPNGYFLSRGPGHVCSAVTWRALLDFFAARGLPTGADAAAPVVVDGKPSAPSAPTTAGTFRFRPPHPIDYGVLVIGLLGLRNTGCGGRLWSCGCYNVRSGSRIKWDGRHP